MITPLPLPPSFSVYITKRQEETECDGEMKGERQPCPTP
jgi:hypothetical protein